MFRLAGRTASRLTPAFFFPVTNKDNQFDKNFLNQTSEAPKNGIERVKHMFKRDEFDEVSIELHNVVQAAITGAFLGACYGGFVRSRVAYMDFIENNQATIFKSTLDAKKKLQDYVTVSFAKGAYQWGWRIGIFSGVFYLIATVIEVYRGEVSLIEYVVSGAITGGLFKANLGLAATLVGAGLGAALSTIAGCAVLGILKLTGFRMDEIRNAMYRVKEVRKSHMDQAIDKSAKEKHDAITDHHETMVKEKGETTIDKL